jgi:myo-inositol-1(or 4)-monophosphatase
VSERDEVLELAIRLAREAGAIQRERYGTKLQIETKSADVDLVTEVDTACEALSGGEIERLRADDAILAEEGGGTDRAGASWRWIIDPLDGTTNYAHAYPRFCVSIGIEERGEPAVGVVYDPLMDELFTAVRGQGARLNGVPIHVSAEDRLARGLMATGFAYDRRKSDQDNVEQFKAFLKEAGALRRDGSAALDLCYVAAGRLDGYWELKLSPWDVAAGCLIVEEAGGRTSDARGGNEHWTGRHVVASNTKLHAAMLELLAGSDL